MADNDRPLSGRDVIASIRDNDSRVDVVIRAFVAQRLGWTLDDPVDKVVPIVLESMSCGSYVVGAKRLLEHLDSLQLRDWVGKNGEDAALAVMTRLDDRVRELTYQRDQALAALHARDNAGDDHHDPRPPADPT